MADVASFERRHAPLIEAIREGGHCPTVASSSVVDEDGYIVQVPVLGCSLCLEIREMWPWRLFRGLRADKPCREAQDAPA